MIVDGGTEDNLIEADLNNEVHYREILSDPTSEYIEKVTNWADKNLEDGNITKSMHQFVTDIDQSHAANPKPLYKTHKRDVNGEILKPPPIRNVTAACGTPVANLAKLMQCNISHLTTKENLPLRNSSTNQVLRKIIFINENYSPLSSESILTFPDITAMYPNCDVDEAIQTIGNKYETKPSKYELPKECIIEALKLCQDCNCVTFNNKFFLHNGSSPWVRSHRHLDWSYCREACEHLSC